MQRAAASTAVNLNHNHTYIRSVTSIVDFVVSMWIMIYLHNTNTLNYIHIYIYIYISILVWNAYLNAYNVRSYWCYLIDSRSVRDKHRPNLTQYSPSWPFFYCCFSATLTDKNYCSTNCGCLILSDDGHRCHSRQNRQEIHQS